MKIKFLGTGTSPGVPMIGSTDPICFSLDKKDKRLRASVSISWGNYMYIIDCSPDFRYQMLRSKITAINGIFFTHEHADHTAGFDDIRPFFFKMGPVPIYAQKRVLLNLTKRFEYIFSDKNKYPGTPSVKQNEIDGTSFNLAGVCVQPISVLHGNLPIFGYRFGDVAYLTDVKTIEEVEKNKLKGLKVLILNALRHEPHPTHLNLEEALSLVNQLRPDLTYFTHISQDLGFHKEIEKILPYNVHLAYDTLEIEI